MHDEQPLMEKEHHYIRIQTRRPEKGRRDDTGLFGEQVLPSSLIEMAAWMSLPLH